MCTCCPRCQVLAEHFPNAGVNNVLDAKYECLRILRDNLSHQAAHTQQALQLVVPTAPGPTYSRRSSVYGSVGRQVGVHKFLCGLNAATGRHVVGPTSIAAARGAYRAPRSG